MNNYQLIFDVRGLENSTFNKIEELKDIMGNELIRVYNIYADKTNSGVTEMLNKEFENLYPNYFENNKDKEWYDLVEYNSYIAEGYQRLIVDDFNKQNISPILDFYVEPTEIVFTGYLKLDKKVTISFYLKEV
jgi:folylpolyglutamate synthase/dihydropteroate synthase